MSKIDEIEKMLFKIKLQKIVNKIFPNKNMRAYKKMIRRHRKELKNLFNEVYVYDYTYLHSYVILCLEHMYEYYSKGNNVWQEDKSRLAIVNDLEEILNKDKNMWNILKEERFAYIKKEEDELFKEIYKLIGEKITRWWD